MNHLEFYCNKKRYSAKRINDFYFQLLGFDNASSLQNKKNHAVIISDGTYLFINKDHTSSLCSFCFQGRYFCFLNGIVLGTELSITTLEKKQWETFFTDDFCSLIHSLYTKTTDSNVWSMYEIASKKRIFKGEIASYEHCKDCFPLTITEWNSNTQKKLETTGDKLVQTFKARAAESSSQEDQKSFISFLRNSFGFISYLHSFKGSGLFPDPLNNNYLATVFCSFPSSLQPSPLSLFGAQAATKKLSQLKALMEYGERYVFHTFRSESPAMSKVDESSFSQICTLLKTSVFSSSHTYDFDSYALWGIDLITEKKKLIPLSYVYDISTYLKDDHIKSSSYQASTSGFAAHVSQTQAIENALLELIERDAFLRWWKNPQTGISLHAPFAQQRLDHLVLCIREHIKNDEAEIRLILLPSPLSVHVVMACITSKNSKKPPALIIGTAAKFSLKKAIESALDELTVGLLNLIARVHESGETFETLPLINSETIKTAQDHFYLFHYPQLITQLPFHEFLLNQKPIAYTQITTTILNLENLKKEIQKNHMNAFIMDMTPHWLRRFNIHIIRCGIFELFPLHFGHPLLISMKGASSYSVKTSLPHCFP